MFIPTTKEELAKLGWQQLDIILVSGDTYIDTPYNGVAIIGKVLIANGFKVGIIAQPDIHSAEEITRLGAPKLFWGVSAGCVDSMVANYTATKRPRKEDDFTAGIKNIKRPDRASIVYSNLIRQHFKNSVVVLGGIEASLRRVAHYDFWSNKIRGSLLFDAKADLLVYGMAERSVVALAKALDEEPIAVAHKKPLIAERYPKVQALQGICYISREKKEEYLELPSVAQCQKDKAQFTKMFHLFYKNNEPVVSKGLYQEHNGRFLIQNPPSDYMDASQIDAVYDIEYERDVHPYYKKDGEVRALKTIQFSITTHHGCYGECNFCAISVHQGRGIRSRSETSILKEVEAFKAHRDFKGIISDVGGATANMYGYECDKKLNKGACVHQRCVSDKVCKTLKPTHARQINLLKQIRTTKGVKKVFVNSGIRYDLIHEDRVHGQAYLKEIVANHVSGQMKIAPEHTEPKILKLMGKPDKQTLLNFKKSFDRLSQQSNKKQFLTYYFIAGHPGCTERDMLNLKNFTNKNLSIRPEQVQVFIPTPSTYSTLMYYTNQNPWTHENLFVERDMAKKQKQKDILTAKY